MSQRFLAGVMLATLLAACSGSPASAPTPGPTGAPGPGATPTPVVPGATPTPVVPGATDPAPTPAGPTNPLNSGDLEALVRSLVPPGSTEVTHIEVGGLYQLHLTSTSTIDQLEAFWDQAIPAAGMTLEGKYTAGGTLTIGISNPDGGIIVTPDESGQLFIAISLGISS